MNGSTSARNFLGKGSAIHEHALKNFRVDPLAELQTNHQDQSSKPIIKTGENRRVKSAGVLGEKWV